MMDQKMTRRRLLGTGAALAAGTLARAPLVEARHPLAVAGSVGSIPPQWGRDGFVDTGWGHPYIGRIVEASMIDAADDLAMHWGWHSDTIEGEFGEVWPIPSDDDAVRALLAPVPVAIVYYDLCVGTAIPVPDLVQRAFDQLRPVY